RVVSRVYLTGKVSVTIVGNRARGGGLSAGAAAPINFVVPPTDAERPAETAADLYSSNLQALNDSISKGLTGLAAARSVPSGSVRVVAASARSITLSEPLTRPQAIGYLGFDMAIGPDGVLGPPIPTHAV